MLPDLANRMPYFTRERMRENCDRGISGVRCSAGVIAAVTASSLLPVQRLFAAPAACARWAPVVRVRNSWSGLGRFRYEQCFGGLARSGDLLAVIAMRVRMLLSS